MVQALGLLQHQGQAPEEPVPLADRNPETKYA
jgi:hypothetical protein